MLTSTSLQPSTYPLLVFQKSNQLWIASWEDPAIGTMQVTAPTKELAKEAAIREQNRTRMLLTIETWMDALRAKALLPDIVDHFITDALWG